MTPTIPTVANPHTRPNMAVSNTAGAIRWTRAWTFENCIVFAFILGGAPWGAGPSVWTMMEYQSR